MSTGNYLLVAAIATCAMTALAARMVLSEARRIRLAERRARRLSAYRSEATRFLSGREKLAAQSQAAMQSGTAAIDRLRKVADRHLDRAAALEPAPGPAAAVRKIHNRHGYKAYEAISALNRTLSTALRRELSGTNEPESTSDPQSR